MVQSHHSGATKNTILVVDDSTTMRSMVQSFLSQDEFHVQVAKSGKEGLARIQEHCPDLLLLDFIMPGMNGYEVYLHLREQPAYADLPIVIMSGSKVEVFNKFAESKVEQKFVFLSKPFDPETLKKQISLALELRLIPTTVEEVEVVVHEEGPLEPPSHEPPLVEEATVALQDEPKFQEEVEVPVVSDKTVLLNEAMVFEEVVHSAPSHETTDLLVAQLPLEEASIHHLPVEAVVKDETVHSTPSLEPAEIPMAQIPIEVASFASVHELPKEFALENEPIHSSSYESTEAPMFQISIEPKHVEPIPEKPAETTLAAHLENEETAEISKPQVPTEDMSLHYIHQNLAHILNLESYVMGALQNLDERSAEDIRSIKSLADQTTLLQQELMYVRGVLNNLNELPKQLETLKEQVLSQPQFSQAYSDKTEQEHLTIVGDRFNNVDAVLMQSVVTLDRLEEIQAGLGETIHTSYGQLSDRLTAIERRFEAIIVRPADPAPVPVVSSSKSYMPPLLYITIALGALNLGAMVALLLR
jgi:twitching motility two-component system response regulator PilH